MDSDVEPPQKKKKTNPSPPFLSLPNDIIMNCLARIPRSYYPNLCLVCKTFRFLVSSKKLSNARYHLKTTEYLFHICLKFEPHLLPSSPPSWFTLWIKPDQTLTNDLREKDDKCSGNTFLVKIPSIYSPRVPSLVVRAGSQCYSFSQDEAPSKVMRVCKKGVGLWRDVHMTRARKSPVACVFHKKVYVMGRRMRHELGSWAECFNPKTRTWKPLPDPALELRLSTLKTLEVIEGKLVVKTNTWKDYVYDPKRGEWNREDQKFLKRVKIENVFYTYDRRTKHFLWYDTKCKGLKKVRGLDMLSKKIYFPIEIANYCGKLLVLWDRFEYKTYNIWCAVIAIERRNEDQVWGNIEWASVVFTSTDSFDFVRSRVNKI